MQIVINNRNYVTWPAEIIKWFSRQGHEVIVIDNGSKYPPLLEFYNDHEFRRKYPFTTHHCRNIGHRALWQMESILHSIECPFAYTDPDIDFSGVPLDWETVMLHAFEEYPKLKKIGLFLEDTGVPESNPAWLADRFCDHPEGIPHLTYGNYYKINTDTTFAIYRNKQFTVEGLRTKRPYAVKHLPWFITPETMTYEIFYYFTRATRSSITAGRMRGLLEDYARKHHLEKEIWWKNLKD